MMYQRLAEIHQQELRAEADRERLASTAGAARSTGGRQPGRSLATRFRDLTRLLRRPTTDDGRAAI